jgi:hypothetical protein
MMGSYEEQGRPLLGSESAFADIHSRNIRTAFEHAGVGLLLVLPTVIVWQAVPDPIDDKHANNNIFHFSFALAGLHLAAVFGTAVASFVIVIGVHFLSRDLPILNAAAWLWFTTALVLVVASFIEMISLLELGREPKLEKNLIVGRGYLLGPGFVVPDGLALICMGLSIMLELRRKAGDDSIANDLASLLPVWLGFLGVVIGVGYISLSMMPLYATEFLVARYAYAGWGIIAGSLLLRHAHSLKKH